MLDRIGVDQPRWRELTSFEDIYQFIDEVGYPVLVRPSYVLSGAAMNVCSNSDELERFLRLAANVSKKHPVVVSEFIQNAKEIEMDAVAQNERDQDLRHIRAYRICRRTSGDATIQFPPQKLYVETIRRLKKVASAIAKTLRHIRPFNIQFLAKNNDIKVIECNLRASRSFLSYRRCLKLNFIDIATKVMLGIPVENSAKSVHDLDYVGIKAVAVQLLTPAGADPVLGVDMSSTGEVGCLGDDSSDALLKAMLSVGNRIPSKEYSSPPADPSRRPQCSTPHTNSTTRATRSTPQEAHTPSSTTTAYPP